VDGLSSFSRSTVS